VILHRETNTIIGDFQVQPVRNCEHDATGTCLSMARHVREGFLRNTVSSHLRGSRQRGETIRCLYLHVQRPMLGTDAVLGGTSADGPNQTKLIKRGRTQIVDNAANIAYGLFNVSTKFNQ
jgi:hypothetical protein